MKISAATKKPRGSKAIAKNISAANNPKNFGR
jgi:hypothetical protein